MRRGLGGRDCHGRYCRTVYNASLAMTTTRVILSEVEGSALANGRTRMRGRSFDFAQDDIEGRLVRNGGLDTPTTKLASSGGASPTLRARMEGMLTNLTG